MSNPNLLITLAKVIITAAWADGDVTLEEINCLKDLFFRIPDMTAKDWAKLDIYINSPVDEHERSRLIEELKAALKTPADKALAISKLEEIIQADGVISDEEAAVVGEIKASIQEVNVSIFGQMGRLMRQPLQRRSQALENAPNRELFLEDFIKNRVFYNVRRRLALDQAELDIPEPEIRKLSLAGGLMARVAFVDREVTEGEIDAMVKALKTRWGISRQAATLVAEVAVAEITKKLDYHRLSREFFECTSKDERIRFMDVLFSVAEGDGQISYHEIEEIRTISKMLKLTHKEFIDAKLRNTQTKN